MLIRHLRTFAFILGSSALACSTMGCAAGAESVGATGSELVTLDAQHCETPVVRSSPMLDGAGRPIAGTATTTVDGCILAKPGETGAELLARAATLLSDTRQLATLTDEQGNRVFSRFDAGQATPAGGGTTIQDVDVQLNAAFSPSTRLRTTRLSDADGFSLGITNLTPLSARIGFFPVTAVKPKNLGFSSRFHPEANGVTVSASASVILEVQKDRAAESTQLGQQVFSWLTTELAR